MKSLLWKPKALSIVITIVGFLIFPISNSTACNVGTFTYTTSVDNGDGTYTYTVEVCLPVTSNDGETDNFTITPSGGVSITSFSSGNWTSSYNYCDDTCPIMGGCTSTTSSGSGNGSGNVNMGTLTFTSAGGTGNWLSPSGYEAGCVTNPSKVCDNITFTTDGQPATIDLTYDEGTTGCTKTITPPAIPPPPINTCTGNFYDSGGSGSDYSNGESTTTTYCSDDGGPITFDFTVFDVEAGGGCPYDNLTIYDGSSTSDPLIGEFCSTSGPGTITSTNDCITFVFVSDGSVVKPGWDATISCGVCTTFPDASGVITNLSCNGGSDGVIDVTVAGMNSPTFSWVPGGETSEDISGLAAGTYTVTITESGCDTVISFTVTQPPALVVSLNAVTDETCDGACDGAVNMDVTGGTAPYTYSWSNGAITEDISGVCDGTYTLNVTDDKGCTASDGGTVAPGGGPVASFTISGDTCLATNSITFTNTGTNYTVGGMGGATFTWDVDGDATTDYTSESVTGHVYASTGTYTVTLIITQNGCTSTATGTVTIAVCCVPPTATFSINDATQCLTGNSFDFTNTGSTGAMGAYTYAWTFTSGTPATSTTEDQAGVTWSSDGSYNVRQITCDGADPTCCDTSNQTITVFPMPTASTTGTNLTCNTPCDGQASLTGSGGTPGYTYSWSTGASTQNISSLCAGTFTGTVADANLCIATATVVITAPPVLSASIVGTNVTCNSVCNGAADLTPSGGTLGYTYSWSNGSSTQNLPGLCAGTYTATVTDANGCQTTVSVTITEPPVLSATTVGTNLSCNGVCDGEGTATPSGGTGPYTFGWSSGASTQTAGALCAGTYTVTVWDANLCEATATVSITQPPVLSATATGTNLLCNAVCIGQATITGSGGTTAYSYSWSNGTNTQNLSGLCIGTYTGTVTDANGCQATASVTITQPTALSATATGTNLLCNGVCIGQSSVTGSGGVTAYSYSWSNGTNAQNLSSLCTGTYTGTVTDANGCQVTSSVTITQPPVLSITTVGTNLSCNGVCDGQVSSTPSGGSPAYSFGWTNGSSSQNLSSLCAGTFTVTVTDVNGCEATSSSTITQPPALTATLTGTNLLCNAVCIGETNLSPGGGSAPYTYSWSNGSTTQDLNSLCIGTYRVTVTDASGCTTQTEVTITQPTALTATATGTNLLCNAVCIGQASITGSGGTTAYSYKWSNGSSTQNLSSLCIGTYTGTVTDANGCQATASVTITEPDVLSITTTGTNLLCNGVCTGQATATASGGTTAYSYKWSNGTTTQNLTSLCIGTYTATVTDANGCQANASVTITQPTVLSATSTGTNLLCNAVCIGQASITGSGGTTAYTYSWDNGATTQSLSSLCIGTYVGTVTDANGCQATSSITITQPTVLSATATGTNLLCNAVCIGQATVTGSGGTTAYSYSWDNGATTQSLTSLCIGTYVGTVTDANGCQATSSITITQPAPLTAAATGTNLLCNAVCIGQATVTGSGGTTAYTYSWDNG
ncbi:MAG: hypothetical protein COA57_16390, partial [Flavobacteriales bacterium]